MASGTATRREPRRKRPSSGSIRPEGWITVGVRLEPYGPPTTVDCPKETTLGEVKDKALRRLGFTPALIEECILAHNGYVLDESKSVLETGLRDYDMVMAGKPEDVYIRDPEWIKKHGLQSRDL